MKNYKIIIMIAIAGLVSLTGIAYAFSSADFSSKANKWVSSNCVKPNKINEEKSLACFLFYKSNDHDARLTNLEGSSNPTSKVLKIVINNNEFGPVVNEQLPTFFYEPIQRLVSVASYGTSSPRKTVIGSNIDVMYESINCTGTPYLVSDTDREYLNRVNNNLLTAGYNDRYITHREDAAITKNIGSISSFNYNSETKVCNSGPSLRSVVPLYQVTFPVQDPINTQFEFKYN